MRKLTKNEAMQIASIIVSILLTLGLITACTNTLFVAKGISGNVNQKTNNSVKVDSTATHVSTKIK